MESVFQRIIKRFKTIPVLLVILVVLMMALTACFSTGAYLYSATREIPDVNPESIEIEIKNFKADTSDILINRKQDVVFTTEIVINTKRPKKEINYIKTNLLEVNLIDDNGDILSPMVDNGEAGDAVADDGIYSCSVSLENNEQANVAYYAEASNAKSTAFEIRFYSDRAKDEFV
jgi:hypothetical protein